MCRVPGALHESPALRALEGDSVVCHAHFTGAGTKAWERLRSPILTWEASEDSLVPAATLVLGRHPWLSDLDPRHRLLETFTEVWRPPPEMVI